MARSEQKTSDRRAGASGYQGSFSPVTETEPRRVRLDQRGGAVVLLSGGLDSATVLAIARARGLDAVPEFRVEDRLEMGGVGELEPETHVGDAIGAGDDRVDPSLPQHGGRRGIADHRHIDALVGRCRTLLGENAYRRIFKLALDSIVGDIREDLREFGVEFDRWYSEQGSIDRGDLVDEILGFALEGLA